MRSIACGLALLLSLTMLPGCGDSAAPSKPADPNAPQAATDAMKTMQPSNPAKTK